MSILDTTDTTILAVCGALASLVVPALGWLFLRFHRATFEVWERRGMVTKPGRFPFGSCRGYTRECSAFQGFLQQKMYDEFSEEPYFGFYQGSIPFLMLRDPEYIKLVMAKEFSHFRDRQGIKIREEDHLAQHLFLLEGEKWRALRVKMSPVFSSGKLKGMFPLFLRCSQALEKLLGTKVDKVLDAKEATSLFSTDVICSCAFGWDVNSLENSDNSLVKIGRKFMELKFPIYYKLIIALLKYLPINVHTFPRLTPMYIEEFMINAVRSTIESRQKTGVRRNDFIDLMLQAREKGIQAESSVEGGGGEHIELTTELMTAQCFVFFLAGFESSSSIQALCMHELSWSPQIQDRLHREVEDTLARHGSLTYQALEEMQYLDMVVHGCPGLWVRKVVGVIRTRFFSSHFHSVTDLPPHTSRRCVAPFTLPDGRQLLPGDRLLIPLWSLHHDPSHFPDPQTFDPERFAPQNRAHIHPYVYMPFGEGPRRCIGVKFGLLQTKIGIVTVVSKYRVLPSGSTPRELQLDETSPLITKTKGPVLLRLARRT